ncbi:phage minor tail protein L [Bordetella genomosp. 13]|uniref:phage minor tail protein L n=1 Tax=Bordetella genomosp. 13 TaxID=463040 RepID=UPI00119DC529|nr:phage minor tail protein L [Bordetella genomosp. 13]
MPITADVQRLEPGALVRLFELDATGIGGDVLRFHGHAQSGPIWWQGQQYDPWAIEARDFQRTGEAQQPSPTLAVGNIGQDGQGNPVPGVISALCLALDDMVGAVLTVRETLGQYLDAANFPDGNSSADPVQELPTEVWIVEQKTSESAELVEFELANSLSFDGRQLPGRQIVANMCPWLWIGGYRGPYCQYTDNKYFDAMDNMVTDPALDKCGGRVTSCKRRFGEYAVINFGGFPAADRLR